MWRRRTWISIGLGALAGVLLASVLVYLLLGVGSPSSHAAPTSSSNCSVHYHPVASCSVPNGGSLDPCSIVTAGLTHCAFTLPDFNPADWANWLACEVVLLAQTIWNAIVGYVGAFLVYIATQVLNAVNAAIGAVLNVLAGAVSYVTGAFSNAVTSITSQVSAVAQQTGPFAPVVVILLTALLFLLGFVAIYFAIIFSIALGKTMFNLL
ncbi:MAG TPA: hypothetical protein VGV89_10340 [Thermoplasmata archaeon]|nr:hypothetical protein [Thermoplasmata archaeon]